MKRITVAICLSALFTVPVYADSLCQEEAKAEGYVGPADTLKPCTSQNAPKQASSGLAAKARESQDQTAQKDSSPIEQFSQLQIQE